MTEEMSQTDQDENLTGSQETNELTSKWGLGRNGEVMA